MGHHGNEERKRQQQQRSVVRADTARLDLNEPWNAVVGDWPCRLICTKTGSPSVQMQESARGIDVEPVIESDEHDAILRKGDERGGNVDGVRWRRRAVGPAESEGADLGKTHVVDHRPVTQYPVEHRDHPPGGNRSARSPTAGEPEEP
jgi:hypothetical protein